MDWKDPNQVREYHRLKAQEYRRKNPEKFKNYRNQWRKDNLEKCQEYQKQYEKKPKAKARHKRYRERHPEKIKELQEKRKGKGIRFKDKWVRLDHVPRIGICAECHKSIDKGEIKITNLHHFKYDKSDPLAHTVELCVDCHNNKEPRKRNELGQYSSQ